MRQSRAVLSLVVALALFALATPASAARGTRGWPGFRVGIGGEMPVTNFVGGNLTPSAEVRFLISRVFVILDVGYTVTSIEEKGNEDFDAGHNFIFAAKAGYNFGSPTTHLGVGGGVGVHGFSAPTADVGAAINIMMGAFPEAFITDGFAFTGFVGLAFTFYTKDATSQEFQIADHSMFRFSMGSATPLVSMGFMYYF